MENQLELDENCCGMRHMYVKKGEVLGVDIKDSADPNQTDFHIGFVTNIRRQ